MKKDPGPGKNHRGKAWDQAVGSGWKEPPTRAAPEPQTPAAESTESAGGERPEGVDGLETLGDALLARFAQDLRTEVGRMQSQLQADLAGVRDQLLEQQLFQPPQVEDVAQILRAEMAALREVVERRVEGARDVGVSAALTEAMARLTEEQRRQRGQLAEQLAAEQRNQQARHDEALQAVLTRLAEAFQARSDEVAEERHQQQVQLGETIQALRTEVAGARALVEGPVEVAEQAVGLPAALAAATERLVLQQREQEARHEQALQAIEERVESLFIDQGRDLRAQLAGMAGALPDEVAAGRERVTRPERQAVGAVDAFGAAVADVIQGLRAEMAALRAVVERPAEGPREVVVPPALTEAMAQLVAEQRNQQASHEAFQAISARLAAAVQAGNDQLAEEQRQQQAQLGEMTRALWDEVASMTSLLERPIELPDQVLGLPAAMAAVTERLVRQLREQEARHEQALQAIEGRVESRFVDQGRDLRAQLSEIAEALPIEVVQIRAAIAALGQQLVEERRQQRGQPAGMAESLRAEMDGLRELVQTEMADVRGVVARVGEVPEPVLTLPAAFAALEGRLVEGASEVAQALREEIAALVGRVVRTLAAQVEAERRHQEAGSARAVEAVRAEMSTLRELVERAVEVPASVVGLAQTMAALESRLVEAYQKRDVEVAQQLRAEAASLRALVERLPEAAAALDRQLTEDRRQQQADVAEVAQLVRAEMEHVRAMAERPLDVPGALLGLPQSVAALQEQLVEGQRQHEARHGDAIETVAAQLREQLGMERELQRAHIESVAAAAGAWFVQARDLILERVDKVAAAPHAPGPVDVSSIGAVDDLLAEVRSLRGELEAIDSGLGALSRAVKSLMDDGRAAGRRGVAKQW